MVKQLQPAPDLKMPLDAVTETFGLLATRGAGKTYAAKVIAEEMLDAGLHVVVLDPMSAWWGLRSSADGKSPGHEIAIFGGDHADLPLEPTAGKLIAQMIVSERISAILDVSEFSKGKRKEFVADFLEELYRKNREALHLIVEEADMFAPQKPRAGEERMLGAMEDIVRRGRGRGIGTTLITQRNAVINKDVIELTSNLIAMRTMGVRDRAAIDAWLDAHGSAEERKEIVRSLPSLKTGQAWFYSPHFLGVMKQVTFRAASTFDSSATPKPGQSTRKPKTLADIDVDALRSQMAETVERQKANDPKELKAQLHKAHKAITNRDAEIALLHREMEHAPKEAVEVKVPVLDPATGAALEAFLKLAVEEALPSLEHAAKRIEEGIDGLSANVSGAQRLLAEAKGLIDAADATFSTAVPPRLTPVSEPPQPSSRPRASEPGQDGGELSEYARHLLQTFGARHPMPLTDSQLSILSGRSRRSSAFPKAIRELRAAGLIEVGVHGGQLTEAGIDLVGYVEPKSQHEIQEQWRRSLPPYERAFFDVLLEEKDHALTEGQLAELTGRSTTSSAFPKALRTLKKLGLIERQGECWAIASDLV